MFGCAEIVTHPQTGTFVWLSYELIGTEGWPDVLRMALLSAGSCVPVNLNAEYGEMCP